MNTVNLIEKNTSAIAAITPKSSQIPAIAANESFAAAAQFSTSAAAAAKNYTELNFAEKNTSTTTAKSANCNHLGVNEQYHARSSFANELGVLGGLAVQTFFFTPLFLCQNFFRVTLEQSPHFRRYPLCETLHRENYMKTLVSLITLVILGSLLAACGTNATATPEATAEVTAEATPEATEVGTETTVRGTVVEFVLGIAFDGNNEITLATEDGQITVLTMESGFVPEDMRDQVCDKNPEANEIAQGLQAGDEIEVFGLLREDGVLSVCGDARFTITVLSQVERTEEANIAERPVSGTVVENNHSCEVDAICYLVVETESEGQWTVVYGTGERLPVEGQVLCNVTSEYTQLAWNVEVGAEIEAFGRVRGENEIGLCYEGEYTLVVK